MPLKVYNTLTKKKEEFVPLKEGEVSIYVCGPTVYDYSHIGHAFSYIAFDVMKRYLRYKGYRVRDVQNLTDIEDKIIERAKETGEDPLKLSAKFGEIFLEDMDALGIKRSEVNPKASEHVPEIIALVEKLVEKGYAYVVGGGDVFFEVAKFKEYGKLSGQSVENLKAGARVELDARKRAPEDFVLWKTQKPGEPAWDSPWGRGRPGWHIECSAMNMKYLGEEFDIHGGGQDLIFPHHECEIAQSEAANGVPPARYWLHNGLVTINGQKMSKSLKNFITARDALQKYGAELIRYWVVKTHWHDPIDYSPEKFEVAKSELQKMYDFLDNLEFALEDEGLETGKVEGEVQQALDVATQAFEAAMDDDFNTPQSLVALFQLREFAYKYLMREKVAKASVKAIGEKFRSLASVLGLFLFERKPQPPIPKEEIESRIAERDAARKAKDFAASDKIRAELKAKGIILEDTPGGIRWRVVRA
jgi:cysteinyl-tRNA synthetase